MGCKLVMQIASAILHLVLVGPEKGVLRVVGWFLLEVSCGLVILMVHVSVESDGWSVILAVVWLDRVGAVPLVGWN